MLAGIVSRISRVSDFYTPLLRFRSDVTRLWSCSFILESWKNTRARFLAKVEHLANVRPGYRADLSPDRGVEVITDCAAGPIADTGTSAAPPERRMEYPTRHKSGFAMTHSIHVAFRPFLVQ